MIKVRIVGPALLLFTLLLLSEARADSIVITGTINGAGNAADFSYQLPAGQNLSDVVVSYTLTLQNNTSSSVTVFFQMFGRDTIYAIAQNAGTFTLNSFFTFEQAIRPEFLPLFFNSNSARLELFGSNPPPALIFSLNSATLILHTSVPPPPPEPTPEPATLFLLGTGLAGVMGAAGALRRDAAKTESH